MNKPFPRFFDVDGTLVKFEAIAGSPTEFTSRTLAGKPFPVTTVFEDGKELTAEEFSRLVAAGSTFPRFFDVDGTLVKVDLDPKNDEVFGIVVSSGAPYPPVKARAVGTEVPDPSLSTVAASDKLKVIIMNKIYPPIIQEAIIFASEVHKNQKRKGKDQPYISHPMAVGLILARVTDDSNVIAAGILHDTIEDCRPYGSITKELIIKEFGKSVAEMVNDVTEQDKSLSWDERKRLALEHIPLMSKGSLLVKSADALHNMVDQIADYKILGDVMFERFNAGKDKQIKRYEHLVEEIRKAYPSNPLGEDLKLNLKELQKLWLI